MSTLRTAALAAASFVAMTAPSWAITSTYRATSSATPAELWAKVGDFCGIGNWLPAVQTCTLSDNNTTRSLALKGGGTVVEHQTSRNNAHRMYSYKIVSSPLPINDYRSTIKVMKAPGGSAFIWTGHYNANSGTSDEAAKKIIDGLYASETLTK